LITRILAAAALALANLAAGARMLELVDK